MIKILHTADWHLDSPLHMRSPEQSQMLRREMLKIPEKIVSICQQEMCDMLLISGDVFDGPCNNETLRIVKNALEEVKIPVFISPGNHDFLGGNSPWLSTAWPENVHIFRHPSVQSVAVAFLDCRVYGAGFVSMDCPALLENFTTQQEETYAIGLLHGDPTQANSPYCPITAQQVANSNLDYLALGHIHKGDQFTAGKTLCAWPGCPMGRGYDELGEKGALLVTLDETVSTRFVPLGSTKFFDLEITAGQDLASVLPPVASEDFYRITFVGTGEPLNLAQLAAQYSQFPNLELRDKTTPPVDIWGTAGEDTFEGIYFKRLHDALDIADEEQKRQIYLAAQISRQLLDGQEVVLP